MDEISSSDDIIVSVSAEDNNPLYTQIDSLLNESVNDVLMKAPIYRLHGHTATNSSSTTSVYIFKETRKVADIPVPDDFIRIVSITDASFQRPVVELAIEGDDVDKRQHNRHLVAKNAKPVAVISTGSDSRKIRCYSYSQDQTPAPTMLYIQRYSGGNSTDVGLDEYMIDLVSWVCAGRVFSAHGDVNKGKICDDNAMALMI